MENKADNLCGGHMSRSYWTVYKKIPMYPNHKYLKKNLFPAKQKTA
jgi:hypothetical protein